MEIKRIILGLAFFIFLFGNVSAQFVEGNNVTQAQLNSVNIDLITYQDLSCRSDSALSLYQNRLYVMLASCLTLINNNDGTYLVSRETFYPRFRAIDYWSCRAVNTQAFCNNKFIKVLMSYATNEVEKQKNLARSFQTSAIQTLPSDFTNVNIFR